MQLIKKIIFSISFLYLCNITVCQNNKPFKVKRKTPEPNTKLSCASKIAVSKINKIIATGNPDSVFTHYNKNINLCKGNNKYTDTIVGNNNMKIRIFFPSKQNKNKNLPVIIFYHGGGFIWGSLNMYHCLAKKMAKKFNSIIVLPNYGLAPKHPYPNAVNDCMFTLNWTTKNISRFGGDTTKIGLMGDSAGANLALVTTIKNIRENKHHNIKFQILYYPSTTMVDTNFASRKYFMGYYGSWYVLNRTLMQQIKKDYLQNTPDTIWQVSPLYAKYDKHTPPTLIIIAQCDPLRDEGKALATKMKQAGVKVKTIEYKKTIHGFVSLYPIIKQGKKALNDTEKFIKLCK